MCIESPSGKGLRVVSLSQLIHHGQSQNITYLSQSIETRPFQEEAKVLSTLIQLSDIDGSSYEVW
jgi:hypothetical protein